MSGPDNQPGSTSTVGSFDFNRPTIVGLLFLASYFTGIAAIVGVVLAYVWKSEPHQPWEATHYTYQIRTFWIGMIACVLGILTVLFGIGILILALVGIWAAVRSVLSLINAQKREPMNDPQTLLF